MNVLDAVLLLLVVVAGLVGLRSGAVPQLGGLIGAVAGGGLALLALPNVLGLLEQLDPQVRAYAVLASLLFAISVGETIGSTAGQALARSMHGGVAGALDQVGGGLIGLAQGVLIAWLAGGLLAAGPIPRLSSLAQTSTIVRGLASVLPPPTDVAADLSRVLDATGLPDVFVGLEPLPAPPVALPSDPETRAIGADATPSTVRVTSAACGFTLTGTGVVVAPHYVVTNAHVIAGSRTTRVELGRDVHDATAVLFDPELDVALLDVPDLDTPSLRFATSDPARGSAGAALGFPLGGPLTVVPAAVARGLTATGRDIYDQSRVTRDVLELNAQIERGDSGGPFVLADGTIGGLVFAQAKSDASVGYALSPVSVATRIAPAVGRTGHVDTGACIR